MKTTMRDKVCQLIGKYQYLEDYYKTKAAIYTSFIIRPAEPAQADMCGQFLADLTSCWKRTKAAQDDPRKTAPAGKWCANSAAQAAASDAKEAQNNG